MLGNWASSAPQIQVSPTLASPALAVKAGRKRGPSVLERKRKAEAEQIAAEEASAAAKRVKRPLQRASPFEVADASLPNGVGILGRGRAAVNVPLTADGDGVQALQERRQSLLAKADFRPMRAVISVAPAGAGKFDGMPDRDDYDAGPDCEAVWARDLQSFAETNFQGKGVELRTIDQHELKTGFFGCWHEKNGHGEVVGSVWRYRASAKCRLYYVVLF